MTKPEIFARLAARLNAAGYAPEAFISVPGRTELGGNHTDHQRGRVIAAAVTLSLYAAAAVTRDGRVRVLSEGMEPVELDTADLTARGAERGSSAALVRGVCAAFPARGLDFAGRGLALAVGGEVPVGSGLSSSACFEVLVATAVNALLFGGALPALELAKAGRFAENEYFGKPCGLMDQLACALGGAAAIDFGADEPEIERLGFEPERAGYAPCLVYSGAGHADLTEEYAAIEREMRAAAGFFGKSALRYVDENDFFANIDAVASALGGRAALRAAHFFAEDRRAALAASALREGDFGRFLDCVRESGRSSAVYLQNLDVPGAKERPMALTQSLCERALAGRGAVRVHGGGFGGALLCFVPLDMLERFTAELSGRRVVRLESRAEGVVRIS